MIKIFSLKNFKKSDFWITVFKNAILFFLFGLIVSEAMDYLTDLFWIEWYRDNSLKSLVFAIFVSIGYGIFVANKEVQRELPKRRNPPPPSDKKEDQVKEMFEFLKTRAFTLDTVKDLNDTEVWPLWISINDVYHLLSMYETGKLDVFLKEMWEIGHYDWGCDADYTDFPEFPSK